MKRLLALSALYFVIWHGTGFAAGSAQTEGRPHKGPRAYHAMCQREPHLCRDDRASARSLGISAPARLTTQRLRELQRINSKVNSRIRAGHDYELYGVSDFWTQGKGFGDCEDYMIAKKQALMAAGWAADQVLYAVVIGTETPYHAVLIVRTDQGDLVLDNLRGQILGWRASGYRFVVRQSAANPQQWVRIVEPAAKVAERR